MYIHRVKKTRQAHRTAVCKQRRNKRPPLTHDKISYLFAEKFRIRGQVEAPAATERRDVGHRHRNVLENRLERLVDDGEALVLQVHRRGAGLCDKHPTRRKPRRCELVELLCVRVRAIACDMKYNTTGRTRTRAGGRTTKVDKKKPRHKTKEDCRKGRLRTCIREDDACV